MATVGHTDEADEDDTGVVAAAAVITPAPTPWTSCTCGAIQRWNYCRACDSVQCYRCVNHRQCHHCTSLICDSCWTQHQGLCEDAPHNTGSNTEDAVLEISSDESRDESPTTPIGHRHLGTGISEGGGGINDHSDAEGQSGSADEEGDLLVTMDKIFANARVSGDEGLVLVLPADKRSAILNTTLYGNVVESLGDHLGRIANISVLYTRDFGSGNALGNDALVMIPGSETAEFFQYNGPGFQETELTRLPGVGFDWLLTSYYGSVVHEMQDGAASGKNNRICKLTGVRS